MTNARPNLQQIINDIWANQKQQSIYMVLDAAARPELPRRLWAFDSPGYVDSLFEEDDPERFEVAPFLLALTGPDSLYKYLMALTAVDPAGIFLACRESRPAVLAQAKAWLWPKKRDGQSIYFRYYDPRVMSAVFQYHRKHKLAIPVGSFERVFWHDPLREETFQVAVKEPGPPFSLFSPWQISSDLEEELLQVQLAHRIIFTLQEMDFDFYEAFKPREIHQLVDGYIREAESYGFVKFKDILPFCHISFKYPGFSGHWGIGGELDSLITNHDKRDFLEVLRGLPSAWLEEFKK